MSGDGPQVTIGAHRLEQIISAVALASTGTFDEALEVLGEPVQDEFGLVEEALCLFLGELRETNNRAAAAMKALIGSKQELEERIETIERQRLAIRELSTPIIDVWAGVLALPLIGPIDADRSTQIAQTLLQRITETRARWVLIDLTGVSEIDEVTADYLVRVAGAVQLIGSRCIVTGIGPHIVDRLLSFGDALRRLRPMRTLREGLQYCLQQSR